MVTGWRGRGEGLSVGRVARVRWWRRGVMVSGPGVGSERGYGDWGEVGVGEGGGGVGGTAGCRSPITATDDG